MSDWERQRKEEQEREKKEEEERKRQEEEEKRREEENREKLAEEAKLLKTKSDEVLHVLHAVMTTSQTLTLPI